MTFSIKFCFSRFMTGTNYEWRAVGGTCFADTGVDTVLAIRVAQLCRFTMHCMTAAWSTCCAGMSKGSHGGHWLCASNR